MSCIHYKFRSALEYDTITFDGLSISLADLKRSIIAQKKFGKNTDFDLEVTNAQTKEEYKDEMTMIPKNSSVIVRRIPVGTRSKAQLAADRASSFASGEQKTSAFQDFQVVKSNKLSKVADLANADATEEDKLKAMMKQSGEDWDPSQYVRGRRPYAPGAPVPQSYVCYRCGKPGHFIRNCPTNGDDRFDVPKVRRTTGIPRTFLNANEVGHGSSSPNQEEDSKRREDPKPIVKVKEKAPVPLVAPVAAVVTNKKLPSELKCPMCNNLLTDAVLIPCCGTSYCDDCIRNYLLENEQVCPSCGAESVSPDSLVINKQLRQAVNSFKNARPDSPYQPPVTTTTTTTTSSMAKPQPDTKTTTSAGEKEASINKPVENKVQKEVSTTEKGVKEGSPKVVKAEPSHPQPIRVHHRDAPLQQGGGGPKHGGPPFDPRRRQGDFPPRGPPRVPELRHDFSEPPMPHRLPPEHVPRVPALRPPMSGPSHLRPPMPVPGYVHGGPPMPRGPPGPPLVGAPLPHGVPFGQPRFEPLLHGDEMLPRSLTPPMSKEEFYKYQKKMKSRTKKKREPPPGSSTQTKSHSKKDQKQESQGFDFADELSEYRELQRSRQRLRSRSWSPSRSWSRSFSRSPSYRSRSRSPSHSQSRSSATPLHSATPEGWDESRSPSPVSSRGKTGSEAVEADKKRKHKKRKKEQKSKERKKQKTSHKEEEPAAEPKAEATQGEGKKSEKKKRKKKDKSNDKEIEKVKNKSEGRGEEKGESKSKKEKVKKREKEKEKVSETKDKGKEGESVKQKDKKSKSSKGEKRKGKEKKDEVGSSGKKRKSKKKHKKNKRHKKDKSKDDEGEGEKGKGKDTATTDEKDDCETQDSETEKQEHNGSGAEETGSDDKKEQENGSEDQETGSGEETKQEEGADKQNGSAEEKKLLNGSDEENEQLSEEQNGSDKEKQQTEKKSEEVEKGEAKEEAVN